MNRCGSKCGWIDDARRPCDGGRCRLTRGRAVTSAPAVLETSHTPPPTHAHLLLMQPLEPDTRPAPRRHLTHTPTVGCHQRCNACRPASTRSCLRRCFWPCTCTGPCTSGCSAPVPAGRCRSLALWACSSGVFRGLLGECAALCGAVAPPSGTLRVTRWSAPFSWQRSTTSDAARRSLRACAPPPPPGTPVALPGGPGAPSRQAPGRQPAMPHSLDCRVASRAHTPQRCPHTPHSPADRRPWSLPVPLPQSSHMQTGSLTRSGPETCAPAGRCPRPAAAGL